jgi:hypothetical protein
MAFVVVVVVGGVVGSLLHSIYKKALSALLF